MTQAYELSELQIVKIVDRLITQILVSRKTSNRKTVKRKTFEILVTDDGYEINRVDKTRQKSRVIARSSQCGDYLQTIVSRLTSTGG